MSPPDRNPAATTEMAAVRPMYSLTVIEATKGVIHLLRDTAFVPAVQKENEPEIVLDPDVRNNRFFGGTPRGEMRSGAGLKSPTRDLGHRSSGGSAFHCFCAFSLTGACLLGHQKPVDTPLWSACESTFTLQSFHPCDDKNCTYPGSRYAKYEISSRCEEVPYPQGNTDEDFGYCNTRVQGGLPSPIVVPDSLW